MDVSVNYIHLPHKNKSLVAHTSTLLKTHVSVKKARRIKRNRARLLRRKRNKAKNRKRKLQLAGIREIKKYCRYYMETKTKVSDIEPIPKVLMWELHSSEFYWQSVAVGLYYENSKLRKHVVDMHAEVCKLTTQLSKNGISQDEQAVLPVKSQKKKTIKSECSKETDAMYLPPEPIDDAKRKAEMTELYGQMAPKITGMEVAVELNYESYINKHNPSFWPVTPIKFQ